MHGEIERGGILGVDRTARSGHLDRRELLGIQERIAQHIRARSCGVILRRLAGEILSFLTCRGIIDDEPIDRDIKLHARLGQLWLKMDGAGEVFQRDHVVVSERRKNAIAVDQQADVRRLRIDAIDGDTCLATPLRMNNAARQEQCEKGQ